MTPCAYPGAADPTGLRLPPGRIGPQRSRCTTRRGQSWYRCRARLDQQATDLRGARRRHRRAAARFITGSVKGPAADEHAVHRLTSPSELSLVYQVRLLEMSGTAHQPIGGRLVRPRCRPTVMMRRQGSDDMPNASTSPTIVEDSVRAYPSTGECCAAGTPQCEPLSAPHRSSDRSRARSFFRNKRYFRLGTVSDDTFVTVRS